MAHGRINLPLPGKVSRRAHTYLGSGRLWWMYQEGHGSGGGGSHGSGGYIIYCIILYYTVLYSTDLQGNQERLHLSLQISVARSACEMSA